MRVHRMFAAAAALAIAGCGHTVEYGSQFDASQVSKIQKGKTTKQEVVGMFGAARTTTMDSQGFELWQYHYTKAVGKAKAATFIPIVGLFAGGATGQSTHQSLSVKFKGDVVQDHSYSQTASETDTSMMGGTTTVK